MKPRDLDTEGRPWAPLINVIINGALVQLVSDMASKSITSWQQVVVMEFGKRHDTTDTMDFCPRQLVVYVADLL